MWIMSTIGFFSIVQKPWDVESDTLTVRARVYSDLASFQEALCRNDPRLENSPYFPKIVTDFNADYPYRLQAPKADVSTVLATITQDIDYDNFKARVDRDNGARARVYGGVWAALLALNQKPPKEQA